MFLKKIKNILTVMLVTTFIMPQMLFAYSEYIVAGGENIGLQINNNGVIISGFYKIGNISPGEDANLKIGDTIIKVNQKEIYNVDNLIKVIKEANDTKIKITYKRNNISKETTLNVINESGNYKTGLYVRDMISGIGTLTFIDPKTKIYGALGHEVVESTSGVILNVKDGKIFNSSVTGIDKSIRGEPGYKNADVNSDEAFGNIIENTTVGIFGNYISKINEEKLYKVTDYEDIKLGKAKIITVLKDNIKSEYDINILKINNDESNNKNILFEITDENLIKKTGGIVQGMSGSPIVQGNNIIGAVTNVVVNNPKKGYGVLITTMLKEAEN